MTSPPVAGHTCKYIHTCRSCAVQPHFSLAFSKEQLVLRVITTGFVGPPTAGDRPMNKATPCLLRLASPNLFPEPPPAHAHKHAGAGAQVQHLEEHYYASPTQVQASRHLRTHAIARTHAHMYIDVTSLVPHPS